MKKLGFCSQSLRKIKKAHHLFIWQSGLHLFSSLMKIPSSVTLIFLLRLFGFWILKISFLLTRGREKVNNNEIFLQIKNPRISGKISREMRLLFAEDTHIQPILLCDDVLTYLHFLGINC
jgi:hypothetical protein